MKYNNGSFIPIAVGFLGDIEYYFEPNKYEQKFIDTHKNINLIYLKIRFMLNVNIFMNKIKNIF